MDNNNARGFAVGLLLAATSSVGCGTAGSPVAPPPPPPVAQGPPPVVTGISPSLIATEGGASVEIVGTNFRRGVSVVADGVTLSIRRVSTDGSTLFVVVPAHPVGSVDIDVKNSDGASTKVFAAYSYVDASTLDSAGDWGGYPGNGDDRWMEFTIEDGRLVDAVCANETFAFVPILVGNDVVVAGGAFSVVREERVVLSGRIISDAEMVGTLQFDTCSRDWRANRIKSRIFSR